MHFGQRRHLDGIVDDESGLDECALAELAENLVDEFALAHGVVNLEFQLLAHLTDLVFALAFQIIAGFLLDGLEDGQAAVRCLETDDLAVDFGLGLAVHSDADGFEQTLGERHHPVIVLVLHIQLHAGELGIVVAVHTLVAEVLANLVHALKAAHNQALEIQLGGDAHVHRDVQRVEVGDERPCRGTTGDSLQRRGFNLGVAGIIEHLAHGLHDLGALQEGLFHAGVDHQVDIALAVTQFGILKGVVGHAVLHLDHGQRLERLAQQFERLGMDADFARLGAEHKSLHTDEVTHVEQLLEHRVIQVLILVRTQVIAAHIDLHTASGILQFKEGRLAHDAAVHHAASNAHLAGLGLVAEVGNDIVTVGIHHKLVSGIRVDAHSLKLLQTVAADNLLFA